MIPILFIGPRKLLNDCKHSATAIFWRSAIQEWRKTVLMRRLRVRISTLRILLFFKS